MTGLIERLQRHAESGDLNQQASDDMAQAAAAIAGLQAYGDQLTGEKFSDRVHAALQSRARRAEELYGELLYAVESKHPGETRHETALRYIREREMPIGDGACSQDAST